MDDIMDENVKKLGRAVIGHRIVSVHAEGDKTFITLDNGKVVTLLDSSDCCAWTELDSFLLRPDSVDHIITAVASEDDYQKWHIFADMVDVLQLDVSWSEGSGYYGYGFCINIVESV